MVRPATIEDFPGWHKPFPPDKTHDHGYFIRDDAEMAALVAHRETIDGPVRIAPDVCGTLTSLYVLHTVARCDPSLPFGAIEADTWSTSNGRSVSLVSSPSQR